MIKRWRGMEKKKRREREKKDKANKKSFWGRKVLFAWISMFSGPQDMFSRVKHITSVSILEMFIHFECNNPSVFGMGCALCILYLGRALFWLEKMRKLLEEVQLRARCATLRI